MPPPPQVSLHGVEYSILQGSSSQLGPLAPVLKVLQGDLGADESHPDVVFPARLLESN